MSTREKRGPRPVKAPKASATGAGEVAWKTTTHGIVARDAPTVVILRRGPTRHVRMLTWDLRDDTIQAGQWLVGQVDPWPCGVSPNGELFVYEGKKGTTTFTAVSRPPDFSAILYWEYSAPWTGGGFFADDTTLVTGLTLTAPRVAARIPSGFDITNVWAYFARDGRPPVPVSEHVAVTPQARHGWTMVVPGRSVKPNPVRPRLALERARATASPGLAYRVIDQPLSGASRARAPVEIGVHDWVDWAPDGALVGGREGRLFRQALEGVLGEADAPEVEVADLRAQSFDRLEPPRHALEWPAKLRGKRRR